MGLRSFGTVAFLTLKPITNAIAEGGWDFDPSGSLPSKHCICEVSEMLENVDINVEARTAVIGAGGAGCSIVNDIYWDLPSVDTIAVDTDKEALLQTDADKKIFICKAVTNGFGTGGDSTVGKRCAQAHLEDIRSALSGYDAVFIVAGMGGGTGTGAAPVIAEIAQSMNCIVSSIVTNPFSSETSRIRTANEGISRMRAMCPMTSVIENDMITEKMPGIAMKDAFRAVNRSIGLFMRAMASTVWITEARSKLIPLSFTEA